MIVVGGVIPSQDFPALWEQGADAIYPPGTVISKAAIELIADLRSRLDGSRTASLCRCRHRRRCPPSEGVPALAEAVLDGDRGSIARAITLVESTRARAPGGCRGAAPLAPRTGQAIRVGISGVPGAGKSTFINAMGTRLVEAGEKVGVVAVDPSSRRTGGSILGDRTRMAQLTGLEGAFVRPSPSGRHLGGVARATRESMLVLEAAGFGVIIVETVGVGQNEIAVSEMVDTFLLLSLARSGDQLQGIKRGILELADVIAVNKADGEGAVRRVAPDLSRRCGTSSRTAVVHRCSVRR